MTSIEGHRRRTKEHLAEIQDAIDSGVYNKPVTIGFHCSACAVEMLELYLHKAGKITTGKMVKHEWFKRPLPGQKTKPMIERNMPVTFPKKEIFYNLMYDMEENRNTLIYGKSVNSQVKVVLDSFMKVREMMSKLLEEVGEKIE